MASRTVEKMAVNAVSAMPPMSRPALCASGGRRPPSARSHHDALVRIQATMSTRPATSTPAQRRPSMLSSSRRSVPCGVTIRSSARSRQEREPGERGRGASTPGRRGLAAVRVGCERLPPDRHAYGACGQRHQDESGEEEQVERVGHEAGEKLLDAVERNRRSGAGRRRTRRLRREGRAGACRPDVSEPAGRIWVRAPDACQRVRLRAREGGEHASQGTARPIRHRGPQVGVDLA